MFDTNTQYLVADFFETVQIKSSFYILRWNIEFGHRGRLFENEH